MSRRDAFVCSMVALPVSAGLLYLSYRVIASGVEGGTIRDLWSGGIWGLFVGIPGLYFLVGAIFALIVAITGRELPTSPGTGTARNLEPRGNVGSNRSVGAEIDMDDWED